MTPTKSNDCNESTPASFAAAPCSAKRALELCEMWTKTDIKIYSDAPFRMSLEHRLACIREGLADLARSPNDRPQRPADSNR